MFCSLYSSFIIPKSIWIGNNRPFLTTFVESWCWFINDLSRELNGCSKGARHLTDFLFPDFLLTLMIEFTAIFLFILIPGYLLPCWHAYNKYFINSDAEKEKLRIQERRPTNKGIRREIILSLQSILIFSVMGTGLFQMYKAGMTGIYCCLLYTSPSPRD